ncbi:MAG: amino acid--tRNA ligase-related protein [Patescibacteria group bacterium]
MLEDIIKERLKKRSQLEKAGYNPYPARVKRSSTIAEALKNFNSLAKQKKKLSLAGRIMGLRDQGSLLFADLKDESGRIQVVVKKDNLKNFQTLKETLDIGDFIETAGTFFKTSRGEKSLEAKELNIAVKSIRPLPSTWYGLKDVEERFRRRYLDFILNPEIKEKIAKRSEIIQYLRDALAKEGFLEVETPVLQPIPGGATARPFVTHHNTLDADFYLRVAPELYLKRLLVGGFEKVFEIGKDFRNEGIDRDHNPEFTMMELYWAYQDYEGLIKFVEKILKKFIPGKWEKISFSELFKKHTGKNWQDVPRDKLDEMFKKEIRLANKIQKTTFVTDYPECIMPLAKLKEENPKLTESFQLIAGTDTGAQGGPEIVKGFSEMNDPVVQRKQMEEQEKLFRAGNEESSRLDEDFLEALEYGMPPAAGLGLGIDRLIAIITKSHAIKEIITFPTLRPK